MNTIKNFIKKKFLKENYIKKNIRVLYIVGVEDSLRNISIMKNNYNILKKYPEFTWCFNHFDGSNKIWNKNKWYKKLDCIKNVGIGSKITQWLKITPDITKDYDYLWLSDGDIGLEHFNFDNYLSMLVNNKPLLSQPGILGHITGSQKASDYPHLCYNDENKNSIQICKKNIEIMTPFISTKIWDLIYEKMKLTDCRSTWETEVFFNKILDDLNEKKLINFYSPVVHYDFRNLKKINSVDAQRKLLISKNPDNYTNKLDSIKIKI